MELFTGIVEDIGRVRRALRCGVGRRFVVHAPRVAAKLSRGDSISVNGVCQTVESVEKETFSFTAVGETVGRTTLGELSTGSEVNLETAVTPLKALGGHIVQGHVDGVGVVVSFARKGADWLLSVRLPKSIFRLLVEKGSISIDGISLTVLKKAAGNVVQATIVPYTRENTIVRNYRSGTKVNVEADILAKYVLAYLGSRSLSAKDKLSQRGDGDE